MKSPTPLINRLTRLSILLLFTIGGTAAANDTWVDFRAANGIGFPANPFNNFSNALQGTSAGGNIISKSSSTETPITINQSVTIKSDGGPTVLGIGLPQPVKQYNFTTHVWEPFFSFGYYIDTPTCSALPWSLLQAGRVNTVVMVDLTTDHDSCIRALLTGAQERGLKVILGIHRVLLASVAIGNPTGYRDLKAFVESYRDDPALLGWMMGDENDGMHEHEPFLVPETVSNAASLIHSWDAYHQVWQVFGGVSPDGTSGHDLILPYLGGTDVMITDQNGG